MLSRIKFANIYVIFIGCMTTITALGADLKDGLAPASLESGLQRPYARFYGKYGAFPEEYLSSSDKHNKLLESHLRENKLSQKCLDSGLRAAAAAGSTKNMETLLERGARIHSKGATSYVSIPHTAFMAAIANNRKDAVNFLLSKTSPQRLFSDLTTENAAIIPCLQLDVARAETRTLPFHKSPKATKQQIQEVETHIRSLLHKERLRALKAFYVSLKSAHKAEHERTDGKDVYPSKLLRALTSEISTLPEKERYLMNCLILWKPNTFEDILKSPLGTELECPLFPSYTTEAAPLRLLLLKLCEPGYSHCLEILLSTVYSQKSYTAKDSRQALMYECGSPLHQIIKKRNLRALDLFVTYATIPCNVLPHRLIAADWQEGIRHLLNTDYPLSVRDINGYTPLTFAAILGHYAILKKMLAHQIKRQYLSPSELREVMALVTRKPDCEEDPHKRSLLEHYDKFVPAAEEREMALSKFEKRDRDPICYYDPVSKKLLQKTQGDSC